MHRTFVIAEAGVNHNGSLEMALQLVDAAASAGADAVKFQTFRAADLASRGAPKAAYQAAGTDAAESQFEMLKRLELDEEAHLALLRRCKERSLSFLSTPFDLPSLILLDRLALSALKIPSGELTNAPLLLYAARTGRPILLSTGMSTLSEVEGALGVLAFGYDSHNEAPSAAAFRAAFCAGRARALLREKVTLLHCTTEYPAPFDEVNLRVMDTLRDAFALPVGLSDHTSGIAVAIAAAARGACVVEKHFTLDRTLPGPDHRASLEPDQLRLMVESIRQVEQALGETVKAPTFSELKNLQIVRKSLVAARDVAKGETFDEESIALKRPGGGISPLFFWEWVGKVSPRDYRKDEQL